jgi:serine/threonine-protein kinase
VRVLLAGILLLLLVPAGAWLALRDDAPAAGGETMEAPAPEPRATTEPAPPPEARRAVPDVTGMPLPRARAQLEDAGFVTRFRREPSDEPRDRVLRQEPKAGTKAEADSVVVLTVSAGVETVSVPDVEGMSGDGALRTLREAGLRGHETRVESDEPAGTVVRQRPAAGEQVERGTLVRIHVAEERRETTPEPETVRVPRLVGLTIAEARAGARSSKLRVSERSVESPQPPGTVVGQSPRPGAEVRVGSTVVLRVSSDPARVAVPDVTGLDEETAARELRAAGFVPVVVEESTSDPAQDGMVLAQMPEAGTMRPERSKVAIVVGRFS